MVGRGRPFRIITFDADQTLVDFRAAMGGALERSLIQPVVYLASAAAFDCEPGATMMVAAHSSDLAAAAATGLRTAFIARPDEHGAGRGEVRARCRSTTRRRASSTSPISSASPDCPARSPRCPSWGTSSEAPLAFPPMKIAIVGAGAMGSVYAGILGDAGNEVWAVDLWAEHVEAMRTRGLTVEGASGNRTVRINATSDPAEVGVCDLVVISTKAADVEAAAAAAKPLLGPDTVVLPIQNGLGSRRPDRCDPRRGARRRSGSSAASAPRWWGRVTCITMAGSSCGSASVTGR